MSGKLIVSAALLVVASLLSLAGPTWAQQRQQQQQSWFGQQQQGQQQTKREPRKPEHTPDEFKTEDLKSAPQLPYLPLYAGNGTKFCTGFYTPRLKTAKVYSMQFLCKEKPEQVKDWYQAAFSGAGWKLDPDSSRGHGFQATMFKQGLSCLITIGNTSMPGYRSSLSVRYIDGKNPEKKK